MGWDGCGLVRHVYRTPTAYQGIYRHCLLASKQSRGTVGWLVYWFVGWLAASLIGRLIGWLVGSVGLVGLVDWFFGWLVGHHFYVLDTN